MNTASTANPVNDYLPLFEGFEAVGSTATGKWLPGTFAGETEEDAGTLATENDSVLNRTFRASKTVLNLGSDSAKTAEAEIVFFGETSEDDELDDVRGAIRSFEDVAEGWDGPYSRPPIIGVVQDALEVLQNWANDLEMPEPVLAFDGTISLELYDEDGLTKGGFEFLGQHKAVFTVVSKSCLVTSGTFDAESPGEIIRSISRVRRALSA